MSDETAAEFWSGIKSDRINVERTLTKPALSPHAVTRDFERALCEYTGAKYAVTTTSCTMAIQIALAWWYSAQTRPGASMRTLNLPLHIARDLGGIDAIGTNIDLSNGCPSFISGYRLICENGRQNTDEQLED